MLRVYTVGHSNRDPRELVDILRRNGIELLVDVRRRPASRRHPHFSKRALQMSLPEAGIEYLWLGELGGRRERRERSPHVAWKEEGFAAYADHLETDEFKQAAQIVVEQARGCPTALMCAERDWQRCHRRMISDWLIVRGWEVVHIIDRTRNERHRLPHFARVEGLRLVYDGGQLRLPME